LAICVYETPTRAKTTRENAAIVRRVFVFISIHPKL
jgi:hypothetical protein